MSLRKLTQLTCATFLRRSSTLPAIACQGSSDRLWSQRSSLNKFHVKFTHTDTKLNPDEVSVIFVRANGERIQAKGKVGETLLDVVVNNSIDLDGFGACEGTLTCSTCHLIFKLPDYEKLPEKPSDEEMDMLDLAYELTDTSRLGCQITLSKDIDGIEVQLPATINDARA